MGYLFFAGLDTLTAIYPNYYLNIAVFTLVYVVFLKANNVFVSFKTNKYATTNSNIESIPLLNKLNKLNNLSKGMHFAYYISIICLISGWLLLLQSNEYSGLLFILTGALTPLVVWYLEQKSY